MFAATLLFATCTLASIAYNFIPIPDDSINVYTCGEFVAVLRNDPEGIQKIFSIPRQFPQNLLRLCNVVIEQIIDEILYIPMSFNESSDGQNISFASWIEPERQLFNYFCALAFKDTLVVAFQHRGKYFEPVKVREHPDFRMDKLLNKDYVFYDTANNQDRLVGYYDYSSKYFYSNPPDVLSINYDVDVHLQQMVNVDTSSTVLLVYDRPRTLLGLFFCEYAFVWKDSKLILGDGYEVLKHHTQAYFLRDQMIAYAVESAHIVTVLSEFMDQVEFKVAAECEKFFMFHLDKKFFYFYRNYFMGGLRWFADTFYGLEPRFLLGPAIALDYIYPNGSSTAFLMFYIDSLNIIPISDVYPVNVQCAQRIEGLGLYRANEKEYYPDGAVCNAADKALEPEFRNSPSVVGGWTVVSDDKDNILIACKAPLLLFIPEEIPDGYHYKNVFELHDGIDSARRDVVLAYNLQFSHAHMVNKTGAVALDHSEIAKIWMKDHVEYYRCRIKGLSLKNEGGFVSVLRLARQELEKMERTNVLIREAQNENTWLLEIIGRLRTQVTEIHERAKRINDTYTLARIYDEIRELAVSKDVAVAKVITTPQTLHNYHAANLLAEATMSYQFEDLKVLLKELPKNKACKVPEKQLFTSRWAQIRHTIMNTDYLWYVRTAVQWSLPGVLVFAILYLAFAPFPEWRRRTKMKIMRKLKLSKQTLL